MKKIISFSVWGDDPAYLNGSIDNVNIAKEVYAGWICRFYCDENVSEDFRLKLISLGAEVEIRNIINSSWEGLFWRFEPLRENDVEVFISRDIDSRLNYREKAAVDEWLNSDKDAHAMRDHVEHNVPILGGMWGCKGGVLAKTFCGFLSEWHKKDYKGSDQDFLRNMIWDNFKEKFIVHDGYNNGLSIINGKIIKDYIPYNRVKLYELNELDKQISLFEQNRVIDSEKESIYKYREKLVLEVEEETDKAKTVASKFNIDLNDYVEYFYDPIKFFGEHDIRPFQFHKKIDYGTHVGEIIRDIK